MWWLVCPRSNCKSTHHLLKPIGILGLSDEGFIDMTKGLLKKNLLFQNWKCHAYSNGKRSTVPESLIIMALETVFLPKKFARKRVQEMGEVTLVARKSL